MLLWLLSNECFFFSKQNLDVMSLAFIKRSGCEEKKIWKPTFGSRESELEDIISVSVSDNKSFMRDCFENLLRGNALSFLGYPLK